MPITRMRGASRLALAALMAVAATACKDLLVAENLEGPDVDRVFGTPSAVEQTIGTGYQACHNALASNNLMPQLLTVALESYSSLNNFDMGVRTAIPRTPIQNVTGSPSIFSDYSSLARAARLAANAVDALDKLIAADTITPDNGVLGSRAQDLRARAFGYFVIGCNQGWLAMIYDSAGVIAPKMPDAAFIPELKGAKIVMDSALAMFDSAIAITNTPATGANGFPIPAAWLGQGTAGTSFTAANFVKLVRSYRARFRAGFARTPTDRIAVDWAKVTADADAGLDFDFMVQTGGSTGWNVGFIGSQAHVDQGWASISLLYYGMADTSGAYDAWLATPLNSRSQFLVRTPDKRWPAGVSREAQVTASTASTGITSLPYISASLTNLSGDPWGNSFYSSQRTRYIRRNSNQGPWPEFVKAEVDLLSAEGNIRLGNIAAAAAKIDISRVGRAGLPALSGVITTANQPVPGGAGCVPRIPAPPNFTSTVCGNIMEAMKWEKRMETGWTSYARWYVDSRGWGDLVQGTANEYPVPYQEMNARQKLSYSTGGGGLSSAAKGTYGF